jgi:hypothetical protein
MPLIVETGGQPATTAKCIVTGAEPGGSGRSTEVLRMQVRSRVHRFGRTERMPRKGTAGRAACPARGRFSGTRRAMSGR